MRTLLWLLLCNVGPVISPPRASVSFSLKDLSRWAVVRIKIGILKECRKAWHVISVIVG